jgi:hypothetical protein
MNTTTGTHSLRAEPFAIGLDAWSRSFLLLRSDLRATWIVWRDHLRDPTWRTSA